MNYDNEFEQNWMVFHPELRPISWLLRESKSLPWVRFHALPESKRYAEDRTEKAIILDRGYTLADEILGEAANCWRITLQYKPATKEISTFKEWIEDDHDPNWAWHWDATPSIWRRGQSDALLTAIANFEGPYTIWMNREDGGIFAPYDGGFDLFPSTAKRVAELRLQFRDWLSSRPDGL
jgi:hypothetical protein